MAQVVGGELCLPTRPDPRFRNGHDGGVVDHDVDGASGSEEALGESADALEISQVEGVDLDAVKARDRFLSCRRPASRYDDVGAGAAEGARVLQPRPE